MRCIMALGNKLVWGYLHLSLLLGLVLGLAPPPEHRLPHLPVAVLCRIPIWPASPPDLGEKHGPLG